VRGLLALIAALFGFGTCAPVHHEVTPVEFVPAVKDVRSGEARLNADVDGDGRMDTVFHGYRDDGAVVGVCFANGGYAEAPGVGMSESLMVLDVDGDGAEEVLPGGTSSDGGGYDVLRHRNGRLERLDLTLEFGHHDPAYMGHRHAWGCEGPGRLLQVEVDWAKRVVTYTHYRVAGSSVTHTTETKPLPSDVGDRFEYPSTLVTECGRTE
jgi:hypothetical protein